MDFALHKQDFTAMPYSSSISFRPSFLRMARPVGVAAQPPRAVSRRSGLIRRPTERIAITVSSKGIRLGMPASAISALISAFIAPSALRFMHGHSTRPATGSHTRPITFFSAIAAALRHLSALPPSSSHSAAAAIAAADRTQGP